MANVSLEIFKKHVNVDFTCDDTYLQGLLDAATAHVIGMTNRTQAELNEMSDGNSLPDQIVMAVYTLGAHWYNQREAVAGTPMTEVPHTLEALVKPFRKLYSAPSTDTSSSSSS